ncbi:MAG: response regulator transcription factor [Clostridia bacterium]|nr:response regulator transcription factor [Clostridia bacterium]MBQ3462362.1 response regulator transcription factor [Clostridia bacterium]MBQ6529650.1 response regulator transcription factor [Clostridia bacterium]MBQ6558434.1 response regulator transcription factor [Clostridia bacterium]
MRILVVEDEIHLAEALAQILKKNNYTVDVSNDGEDGLDNALSGIYDVIVLDIMLPKMNGLDVLENIRSEGFDTPVILLTAKNEISDKVRGLDSGADDYLAKPFNTEELLARIRALGRRRGEIVANTNTISFADITLNTQTLQLTSGANEITLTLKESELLEHLMLHKGLVCSKEQIIEKLWGFDSEAEANHVEVYISFLRKKLTFVHSKAAINTVRGVGYTLVEG